MTFDINTLIHTHLRDQYGLYFDNVNPRFAKAMQLIGFNRQYTRAKGAYLWDKDGRKYLDMLSGYGVFNLGRNHPTIIKALSDFIARDGVNLVQMDTPLLCGVLAKELKEKVGFGLDYVYFGSTGAEANETAIKFARATTKRSKMLFASSAFHGLTTGALALNGSEVFRDKFGDLMPNAKVPFGDIEALDVALRMKDIAAYFIEPVQGKGVNIAPDGYLSAASELCRKYGTLLVIDEVQSGMGRTGKFLACHHEENRDEGAQAFQPDMVIVSKALSGGFVPISALLMRDKMYNSVYSSLDHSVVHSSTFGKSNFSCVAGLASLHVLKDEQLIENAAKMGDMLKTELEKLIPRFDFMKEVRGRGLMLAIEFGAPQSKLLKMAWHTVNGLNKDLFCQAITIPMLEDHGILTQVAGNEMPVIKLLPPLVINEGDVKKFVEAFTQVLEELHRFPGPAWESLNRIAKNALKA